MRRPWCLLAWSSLLLLEPLSAAPPSGEPLVVAPGDAIRVRPPIVGLAVEAAIDGGPLRPIVDTVVAPDGAGFHWLTVASRDGGGQLSPLRWIGMLVDDTGPETALEVVPAPVRDDDGTAWIPPGAEAVARAVDRPAGVRTVTVTANDEAVTVEAAEAQLRLPASGRVAVGVVAVDRVANRTEADAYDLAVDAHPPEGSIVVDGPQIETDAGLVLGPEATLRVELTDDESGVAGWQAVADDAEVDQAAWRAPWPAGPHRAAVRPRDRVGNTATLGPLAFTVDDQGPAIRWSIVEPGATSDAGDRFYRSPVTVTAEADDPLAGVASLKRADGDADVPGTTTEWQVSGTSLRLRAVDRVGNETLEEARWQIDDTAPTVEVVDARGQAVAPGERIVGRVGQALTVTVADVGVGIGEATYRLNHTAVPGRSAARPLGERIVLEVSGVQQLTIEVVDRLGHRTVARWRLDVAGRS